MVRDDYGYIIKGYTMLNLMRLIDIANDIGETAIEYQIVKR